MSLLTNAMMASRNRPVRVSARLFSPLATADAKRQLEIASTITRFDDQLTDLITEALDLVERDTAWVATNSDYTMQYDCWPTGYDPILLPIRPVRSITALQYFDATGTQVSWASSNWRLDTHRNFPVIFREHLHQAWPTLQTNRTGAITVACAAGYASLADLEDDGGQWMRQAALARLAMLWHDRGLGKVDVEKARRVYRSIVDGHVSPRHIG